MVRLVILVLATVGILAFYGVSVAIAENSAVAAAELAPYVICALGLVLMLGSVQSWRRRRSQAEEEASSQTSTSSMKPSRKLNLWMAASGVGCFAVGIVLLAPKPPLTYRILPTHVLVEDVKTRPADSLWTLKSLWHEWDVLQTRQLTDQQIAELAGSLLSAPDLHTINGGTLAWSRQLLGLQLVYTGRVPFEIVDQYFRERLVFEPKIIAPETVARGTDVVLDARAEYPPAMWIGQNSVWAYVGGFYVDDAPVPLGRVDEVIPARRLSRCRWIADGKTGDDCSKGRVTAGAPGSLRIRWVVWIIVHPQWLGREPVSWREDGTPELPEGVLWSKKLEAETVVNVTDET